jgi:hypothetical protein
MEAKYIDFRWVAKSQLEHNGYDVNNNRLFIYEVINSKSYVCERVE